MKTDIDIHEVPVENFIRLLPVMTSLRVWYRRYNGKFYYSCMIELTAKHVITMFTNDLDGKEPLLQNAEDGEG